MKKDLFKLDQIERKVPFEVPEGYFDDLTELILERIDDKETNIRQTDWSVRRTLLTSAASLLILMLVWWAYPRQQTSIGDEPFADVSRHSIAYYLEEESLFDPENTEVLFSGQIVLEDQELSSFVLEGLSDDLLLLEAEYIDDSATLEEYI